MTININITSTPDLFGLSALHHACFDPGWSPTDLAQMLKIHGTFAFIASSDATPPRFQGFALLRLIADEGEILSLAVAAHSRQLGIGSALVAALVHHAQHSGAKTLFLEVRPSNKAAIALYEKAGFSMLSLRKDYYRNKDGSAEHALILCKRL